MLESISTQDTARLRELGKRVAELAADPQQNQNRQIWRAVNDGAMIRPAVLARDYPVYLLEYGDELTVKCEDPFLRTVEAELLLKIYEWNHLRCHRVIENFVYCQADIADTGFGIEVSSPGADDITTVASAEISSARHFDRIISCEDDLAMIKDPVVTHNEKSTQRRLEVMREIFDGVIQVRLHGADYFQYVPWDDLLSWMGIEEGMYDFVLEPDFMHKAIKRFTDAWICCVKQYEELGLLTSNNLNHVIGAGGYGYTSLLVQGEIGQEILKGLLDNWDIRTLAFHDQGFRHVWNNQKPITTLEDLKGMKLRGPESPIYLDTFKLLNVNITPISWGETYTAIQTGVVVGLEQPMEEIVASRYYEICSYGSFTYHMFAGGLLMIREDLFQSLTPEEQKILVETCKETEDLNNNAVVQIERDYMTTLTEKGMKLNDISAEELAKFGECMAPLYQKYAKQLGGEDIVDRVRSIK